MKRVSIFLLLLLIGIAGCNKGDDDTVSPYSQTNNGRHKSNSTSNKDYTVHRFVWETMYDFYYWNENIPSRIDITKFDTPNDVFENFRYTDDRFSAILNNYTEIDNYFNNEYVTDGLNLIFGPDRLDPDKVVAYVQYVYKDSPAEAAGLKRGHVITKVNGQTLDKANYSTLFDLDSYTLTYSTMSVPNGMWDYREYYGDEYTTPRITKKNMNIDPVLQVSTHYIDGHTIGYFLYDSFDESTDGITEAIEKFQADQITDLVLDLRFNGGGYVSTLEKLVSMLVPAGNEGKLFIQTELNSGLTQYFKKQGEDFNSYFSQENTHLNINKLYVLTSYQTASASEELISGLKPYMDVVIIGTPTYGKYTTNMLLNDIDDKGTDADGINYSEWALYIVVGLCKNANGEMNFKDGFTPDYSVDDMYDTPLGSEDDPLFAQAISLITGKASIAKHARAASLFQNDFIGTSAKPFYKQNLTLNRPRIFTRQ